VRRRARKWDRVRNDDAPLIPPTVVAPFSELNALPSETPAWELAWARTRSSKLANSSRSPRRYLRNGTCTATFGKAHKASALELKSAFF